ncbi:DNA replication factor Cdt1 isoform X1 [Pempheris klunzingeri]|uniref:DNA replication factor Cdt1 isoform X1 n=1 Tax=Pempheris klunzingeri TaxID=3127111 RepID=UPI003981052D
MSQARVTDFFHQRKKGPARPVKLRSGSSGIRTSGTGTRSRSSANRDPLLRSSSVHEEFVRVIDEAVGLKDADSAIRNTAKDSPCSPRTPKRTSADTDFDVAAAVFSATAEHSTAKKRRPVEAIREAKLHGTEKATRKKAKKKLVLPRETEDVVQPVTQQTSQTSPPPAPVSENHRLQARGSPQREISISRSPGGQASKALSQEGLATLKSRLQRIKKYAEEITNAAPTSSSVASPAGSAPNSTNPPVPETAPPLTSDAKALKLTVAQAKERAAKALRRKEEKEAERSKRSETQTQDSTEQPAYQRYHNLAQATPPGLSLPYHYKVLAEMFRSMDTVVAMLYNRCETATFTKIKQGVQDMMHKRFEEGHMGQIKTVFPEAYTFRQEKNIPTFNNSIKKGSYQLTVEPAILCGQNEARPVLSASRLLERRHIFHQNLVSIVKQHHKVFLSSLVPPVSVPEDKLTRWHPRFNVDTVSAVQASLLPLPPHSEKVVTAQEMLDKARSIFTPKMEKALVSLALKTEDKLVASKETKCPQNSTVPQISSVPATEVPGVLKGVSQSLLDRIRAKEAQKLQAAMTRNPIQEERLQMMSRLPELARILRNVFVAEKKPALIMEVACNKMVASYRSALSTGEMEKHIRLLAEVTTDWLTIHPIRKDFYLKLNKNMELNTVLDKMSSRLREEEKL